jgi:transcriptional regulator with XRE-family HTH domain
MSRSPLIQLKDDAERGRQLTRSTVCAQLRAWREHSGLTVEQLSSVVGVSRQTLSRWEAGATFPDLGDLGAVSVALGIDLHELLSSEPSS